MSPWDLAPSSNIHSIKTFQPPSSNFKHYHNIECFQKPVFSEDNVFQPADKLSLFFYRRAASMRSIIRPYHRNSQGPCASVETVMPSNERRLQMQIYMFTSQASPNLHAFAGDASGSKLPEHHGPWDAAGSLRPDQHPPHQFSRARIEQAIKHIGFQLWRMKSAPTA